MADVAGHPGLPILDARDTARARAASRHQEHFEDLAQQAQATHLGMWIFLASEVLFFGALFALYAGYRAAFPQEFADATAHSNLLLGTVNTYILLLASFLVAWSVGAIRSDRARFSGLLLHLAMALGIVFLAIKATEYREHFAEGMYPGHFATFAEEAPASAATGEALDERGMRAFFTLYYLMTGLHFLHVAGGVVLLGWTGWRARRGAYSSLWHTPLELSGMYWHFVDLVWLFVWPCFYLLH